jgi:hypothetical protein
MPRPTTTPRLSALDPVKFAVETVGEVKQHLYDLGCCLCRDSSLEADLMLLCQYAQGKVHLGDDYRRKIAKDAAGPIYLGQEELGEPSRLHDDWRGRCDIVFRAAICRGRIERGRDIVPGDLAALASMSAHGIRAAIKRGEIATEHGVIPASEAKRWLEARALG